MKPFKQFTEEMMAGNAVGASGGFAHRNIDYTKYNENNPDQPLIRRQ